MRALRALERVVASAAALALGACEDAGSRVAQVEDVRPNPVETLVMEMAANLEGFPGPSLTFETLGGDVVELVESYGRRPVYLKMWATWCGPCRAQMPHLESTYARIKDDFVVLAVATGINETEEDVRAFVEQTGLVTPMAVDDGRLAAALGLRVTPVHVVIGRDGRILHVGQRADERLEAALIEAERQASPADLVEVRTPDAPTVYARLPDLFLATVEGDEIQLAPTDRSEPTALVFFLPWCESYFVESRPELTRRCREVREHVNERQGAGGARWIGVASRLWAADASGAARYQDDNDVSYPLVFDETGALFESFGVRSTPVIIVFDARGEIVARIDDTSPDLHAALEDALVSATRR
jgi:peroxiredoxin